MIVDEREYIVASDGMVLTDGIVYGRKILVAEGVDASVFYEITEEEYNELINEDPENTATEEDYQNALKDLGVEL